MQLKLVKYLAFYAFTYLLLVSALLVADALSSSFDVRYVATESMEPCFPRGSIVVVQKDVAIAVGDPVMYVYPQAPSTPIFHRVIAVNGSTAYIKGDAVDLVERVELRNVLGVYLFGVPYIMELAALLLSDPLIPYALVITVILLCLSEPLGNAVGKHESR